MLMQFVETQWMMRCNFILQYVLLTKGLQSTCSERVSDVVGDAGASWAVASHLALCIDATSSRAWVDALVPLACFVGGAVRMDNTLRPTSHIWVTKVFRNALA